MTRHGLDAPDVLEEGAWVSDRGVLRWVAAEATPPSRSVAYLIACPTCHALVGQTCRTKSGHTTTPHGSRLAPRLCQCGELLAARRRCCDPCRDRLLQEAKNAWGRRNQQVRNEWLRRYRALRGETA